jgi:uncharacterized protein (DUF3084 family)
MTDRLRPWGPAEEIEALQCELEAERDWRFTAEHERDEARTERDAARTELAELRQQYTLLLRTRNRTRF